MTELCIKNLLELKGLVKKLSKEDYGHPSEILSRATIGQHVRHVLEFYQCLVKAKYQRVVNYDNRERNLWIERDPAVAVAVIDKISLDLLKVKKVGTLYLQGNYSNEGDHTTTIATTFERELVYCLEHTIHHQALIKVGLKELNLEDLLDSQFGIAPATVRFREDRTQSGEPLQVKSR